MNNRTITIGCTCLLSLAFFFAPQVKAEVNDYICGSLRNAYGPFDYRSDKKELDLVEAYHFTPEVANLVSGANGYLGGDLDYTLRAFPNHPGALMAMVRFAEREKTDKPSHAHYTVECYLYRALRFRPDDGMVRMIYATYLAKKGRNTEALKQLNDAVALGESSANLYYNIGLVYFGLKDYDNALTNAQKAYQMGFPLPGLREKLRKIGKWQESKITGDNTQPPENEASGAKATKPE